MQLGFTVEHRRAGKQVAVRHLGGNVETVPRALRRRFLHPLRLVDDHHGEARSVGDEGAQLLVVDQDPLRLWVVLLDGHGGRGIDLLDFALPIDQQGGQGDDQNWPARRSDRSGDDRLAGLAQSHVVGQQGAGSLQQVSDAGRLVGQ